MAPIRTAGAGRRITNQRGPTDQSATEGEKPEEPRDSFASLRPRTRFRLKPGSYAHGIDWCRPGGVYSGEPAHQAGHIVVYAPDPADTPGSVELPAKWFEEVKEA